VNRHVITGCGVVSTLGVGRQAFLAGLAGLTPGAGPDPEGTPVETFDSSKYGDVRVAEVRGFEPKKYLGDKGLRSLDRLSKLLIVATRLALDDAAIKTSGAWLPPSADGDRHRGEWADRVGLVVSNAYGSLEAISELDRVALLEDPRYINPARFPLTVSNSAAGYASIWEDVRALNVTVSGWSCGALDAMACSDLMLEAGRADVLLVGGAEAMTEALFVGFHRLGLQSLTAAAGVGGVEGHRRPRGARLGEGAALVALETRESAIGRNANFLAELGGYGTSFAPPRHTASLVHASADALEIAIREALADAQARPADIDLVVSSLSGLEPFDDAELAAIRSVMGDAVPVTAPKFDLGETLGASGAMAIVAAIAHLSGAAPPRAVHGTPRGAVGTTLLTAMGYYGSASALVLRRASR
jgi:3-oxoacyl-[acyl-carrier-protein] synthase II